MLASGTNSSKKLTRYTQRRGDGLVEASKRWNDAAGAAVRNRYPLSK